MSTHLSRPQIEHDLDQAVQRWGNATVLFTNRIAAHVGLSATEFECVSLLKDEGPLTAGHLARRSGLTTGAITGLIDRLEKAGLAERQPDPSDRRRVVVHIVRNPIIGAKIRTLYGPAGDAFQEILGHYSTEELLTVLDFVDRSVAATDALSIQMQNQKPSKPTLG